MLPGVHTPFSHKQPYGTFSIYTVTLQTGSCSFSGMLPPSNYTHFGAAFGGRLGAIGPSQHKDVKSSILNRSRRDAQMFHFKMRDLGLCFACMFGSLLFSAQWPDTFFLTRGLKVVGMEAEVLSPSLKHQRAVSQTEVVGRA